MNDTHVRIINDDVLAGLATLPDESVHCVVTSPPYWGLRDYGVEGQLGLEATPDEYVARMVEVFREVWRVLRPDGTLWLNLGDCYATGAGKVGNCPGGGAQGEAWTGPSTQPNRMPLHGIKAKDMVGIPWRVAFALQADGWYLRCDIIWSKPNPMPESVTDRPTKAHEYFFLFAKSERYHYDADAIKEPAQLWPSGVGFGHGYDKVPKPRVKGGSGALRGQGSNRKRSSGTSNRDGRDMKEVGTGFMRNRRSVWSVATAPFSEAHFATFPPKLVEPCIIAGCPEGGVVLDPFGGSGTVGMVAKNLNRKAILIELNPAYCEMMERRISPQGVLI